MLSIEYWIFSGHNDTEVKVIGANIKDSKKQLIVQIKKLDIDEIEFD